MKTLLGKTVLLTTGQTVKIADKVKVGHQDYAASITKYVSFDEDGGAVLFTPEQIESLVRKGKKTKAEPQTLAEKLHEKLAEGPTEFVFKKASGEERPARGTTNLDYIPQEKHPTGQQSTSEKPTGKPSTAQTYFDLDKKEWRSCKKDSILSVGSQQPVTA